VCGFDYAAVGTPLAIQTDGDCQVVVCDGAGSTTSTDDDTDLPIDGNECTDDVCTSGVPSNPPFDDTTPCGAAGTCDGAGHCVGCNSPADCGTDSFCQVHTCSSNTCGFSYTAAGTPLPSADQIANDCQEKQCNGTGGILSVPDDQDAPLDDGSECTAETCADGVPQHPPEPLNAVCSDGGIVCDGAGNCVECNSPSQCADQGTACQTATCGSHTCGLDDTAQGTPAPSSLQTGGDCALVTCDGSGGTTDQPDPGDLPVDGDDCTDDVCTGTTPSNPPSPAGTPCGSGGQCDGAGSCSVLKGNGEPCTAATECVSNHCVDGVCCNEACGSLCEACSAAKNGGTSGTCSYVPLGQNPDAECTSGQVCDGAGACTSCGNGTCDAGETETSCPTDCATGAVDVAGGDDVSCAVLGDGTGRCWGDGTYGQLGNGSLAPSNVPVVVTGLANATEVAAGWGHSCALIDDASLRCWGKNGDGQLGNGLTATSSVPVTVLGITTAVSVRCGGKHTCALLADKTVRCWGDNRYGQLGDGTGADSDTPVTVIGLTNVKAVSAGYDHSCAVLETGEVRCWGRNTYGKLGDGTTTDSDGPVAVPGLSTADDVAAGATQTCVLLSSGTMRCWGRNNYGQLGDGTNNNSVTPVDVAGLSGVIYLAQSAGPHVCVLVTGNAPRCWGRGTDGDLGNGTNDHSNTPVVVSGLSDVRAIAPGDDHGCAALQDGNVWCWGDNLTGELGDGTLDPSNVPVHTQLP
jgi:alpha-tubulin suppressor-like RCC1 family protein